ncbi:hypothetical protein [Variovorax sp. PBL-E5]|uniref:hypothetical protein n=1 Tax=Variovorax sp. PBL-E5 TaxID=434014 RepID=UPI001318944C|nr:hypothetical protein [Variovorax sp. PBL-E5]VTU29877.1 hypothetical protein E5CHR_02900 [Variovorax sp. PBL-E5]
MATTANYFMVFIKRNTSATLEDVKEKMNQALDWYRVQETLWIVYSTSDAEKLYARLSPLVKDEGSLFICKLDVNARQGWMGKDFWSWLRREDPKSQDKQ